MKTIGEFLFPEIAEKYGKTARRAVCAAAKNGQIKIAKSASAVVAVLPAAGNPVVLEDIVVVFVKVFELVRRVDIKYENAVRIKIVVYEREAL